ncbi:MAG: hypothetical protein NDI81_01170 [Desulfobacula sp.]|nr:hypothetical protein [Desulfobacula sp.]
MNQNRGGEAADMAPACISAISETMAHEFDTRRIFPGYQLHVYPLYTEFLALDDLEPVATADQLKYDTSLNVHWVKRKKRQNKKDGLLFQKYTDPLAYEHRLFIEPEGSSRIKPKRGQIKNVSKKSSTRLKKRAARAGDLSLWIDLTFSDDVLEKKSISERAQFSYYCLKRLTKYVKETFGLYLIWKRENKERKSGQNKGEIMPHFHVLFGGMTEQQNSKWIAICIQILMQWVQITGTDNDDALAVAINKKSYRKIENPKHATCYISKYFAKTEPLDIPENESIGRCWGTSNNCPDAKPRRIILTQWESFRLVRHLIRKKKLNCKKGRFLKFQLQNGHGTFLFEEDTDLFRYLDFLVPF